MTNTLKYTILAILALVLLALIGYMIARRFYRAGYIAGGTEVAQKAALMMALVTDGKHPVEVIGPEGRAKVKQHIAECKHGDTCGITDLGAQVAEWESTHPVEVAQQARQSAATEATGRPGMYL